MPVVSFFITEMTASAAPSSTVEPPCRHEQLFPDSPRHQATKPLTTTNPMLAATGMAARVLNASTLISCFVCGSISLSTGFVDATTREPNE